MNDPKSKANDGLLGGARTLLRRALETAIAPALKPLDERQPLAGRSEEDEPPVVARLIVEIRSDGTRTIARGALQDELSGEKVALEAHGSTPLQLASQLAKSLLSAPLAAFAFRQSRLLGKKKEP